jgi:predicted O-methyltransferase YrrM
VSVSREQWAAVDRYLGEHLLPADPVLASARLASTEAGLPEISVSPNQGKMLQVLALAQRASRILEIGTLGGYSTIWLARALRPGGRLISLEADPRHAEVARANLARAGLTDVADIRVGRAQDTLPMIKAAGEGPFDLIFVDADKPGYPEYLPWSLRLSRPGTMIIADNVVRNGAVADASSRDPDVQGVQRFIELLGAQPRVSATVVQTVGSKGYDGFALAVVLDGS